MADPAPQMDTDIDARPRLVIVAEQAERVVSESERRLLLAQRQALLIQVSAIEEYLGLERTRAPRRERVAERLERESGVRVG